LLFVSREEKEIRWVLLFSRYCCGFRVRKEEGKGEASIDRSIGKGEKEKKKRKKRKERENEGGRKTSGSRESIYTSIVFFFLGAIDKITRFEK
jgi:hypothetical protein